MAPSGSTGPRVGIAGWSLGRDVAHRFGAGASHLERYATRFGGVEINSSFYRPHRPVTYARWAASVPDGFRFSVKLPRAITHESRLHDVAVPLRAFLDQVSALGDRLGPLLVQLPPSLAFDPERADRFFALLRDHATGLVACEPRHASWFEAGADGLLRAHRVARVAADPAPVPEAAIPGGWDGFAYHRLHGSPEMYSSAYGEPRLQALLPDLASAPPSSWCIFDNTAQGAAIPDALRLQELLVPRHPPTVGSVIS